MAMKYFKTQLSPEEILEKTEGYSSWLEINLDNIGYNLKQLQNHTNTEIMAVVKNNAYGHGLVPITAYLEMLGLKWCMVAKLYEASTLRAAGLALNILNMDVLYTLKQYREVVEQDITQTIYTRRDADRLQEAASEAGKTASVFIKVDTGLNRVGVRHSEAAKFIEYVHSKDNIEIKGMFSTLQQNPENDQKMLNRLLSVDKKLQEKDIHIPLKSIASTDATLHNPEMWLDIVRPGMSLYGVYPEKKDLSTSVDLKQALSFKARIEYVKTVERGETVTYWGKFIAPRRMRIGTIHAGFYDGIPRELANKGRVLVGGVYKSNLGSISLNHMLLDLDGVEADKGTVVEIIGETGENTISKTAETSGWMTYSLLNHLNPYTPRIYYLKGTPVALLDQTSKHT